MLIVGLMSGTSADGFDAAVIDVERAGDHLHASTLATSTLPFSHEVRSEILAACVPETGTVDRICRLNALLGEWLSRAALEVIGLAGLKPGDVDLIASHGQTIYHAVDPGA